jgi:predicted ATPase
MESLSSLCSPTASSKESTSWTSPKAALSPQRQLTFLKIIHDLATPGHAQFLIATHSPIILSYPGAVLFSLDGDTIEEVDYRQTKHFLITRDFLNSPEGFFRHLFETG